MSNANEENVPPPQEFIQLNLGKDVIVKLQNEDIYKGNILFIILGKLISIDGVMNLYLKNVQEIINNEITNNFEHLFIRGNNGILLILILLVLYISKFIK